MNPLQFVISGLQLFSTWLMSLTAVLSVFVAVIVCLLIAELLLGNGALSKAYTVKTHMNDADHA